MAGDKGNVEVEASFAVLYLGLVRCQGYVRLTFRVRVRVRVSRLSGLWFVKGTSNESVTQRQSTSNVPFSLTHNFEDVSDSSGF